MYLTMALGCRTLYLADKLLKRNRYAVFCEEIIEEIRVRKPVLVGISCYTPEYHWTMEMARKIKERTGVSIVVGGIHATIKQEDFIFKGSPVDFAIIGEGETPLTELVLALKEQRPLKQHGSIAYLDKNGDASIGTCNIEKDIAAYPSPDYRKIDMRSFLKPVSYHIRNIALSGVEIFTSRGCPYQCEFCNNTYMWQSQKIAPAIRYRDVDRVIDELKYMAAVYGIDGFYVLDDCFLLSKQRVADFCEKLIKSGPELVWGAETRVNLVNDEALLKLMKRSGLIQLDFGVESGSPAMLSAIQKGITVDQTKKAFDLCRRNGIRSFANHPKI